MLAGKLGAILSVTLCIAGSVLAAPLYGCQNHLTFNGTTYGLTNTDTFSQYIQCIYRLDTGNGGSSQNYCWYDYQNYTLYHYPNTPLPLDSHPACPTTLPLASIYRIRSFVDTSKCLTAMGEYDGAPVQIETCRTDIRRPEQVWHFNNQLIQPLSTDKCLDVTNGNTQNGARLQVWTCSATNPNQQFEHWVKNVVIVPEDHINWLPHRFQCLDLTKGNTANGTPLQLWGCNYQNPNQHWVLEPVI